MMGILKLISNKFLIHRGLNCAIVLRRRYSPPAEGCQSDTCKPVSPEGEEIKGDKKGLVLGVYENGKSFELTAAAEEVNEKSGGKICKYLNELSCEMKLGKAFTVTDVLPEYSVVALASLGPKDPGYNKLEELDETRENIRWGVGAGVRALCKRGVGQAAVDGAAAPDAAAEAAALAAWRFQEYKSCKKPTCAVSVFGASDEAWGSGFVRGRAQNWARYLAEMPANNMTPLDLAQAAIDVLCPLGVRVAVHERAWLQAQRMEALLAVARGSCEEPALLEAQYDGAGDAPKVLLAAKGVTFDSGGLCLKPAETMMHNRGSMSGAAVVLAAVRMLAELKVPVNVVAVIPLCENMVSGQCMKVGDVVRALNGLSIQIENTDMEGRLMLADALVYGQTMFKPKLVIDVATLTRGVMLATGSGAYGCFATSEALWRSMRAAGAATGDRPWRLPLWGYYQRQLTDEPSVDLRNQGSGHAAPCLGAAFLKRFVCCDWMHVDVTGVARAERGSAPYLRERVMAGRPARALAHMLAELGQSAPNSK